ncbi:fatty acid desaturase-domain-containing protein [Schizophyllum fasciatum]
MATQNEYKTSELENYVVPEISVKELLGFIPAHCFERSALRSSLYIVQDLAIIGLLYKGATHADARLLAGTVSIPDALRALLPPSLLSPEASSVILPVARTALWGVYGYFTGLFATGLWIIAHEAGHQAFSPYRTLNDVVGWVLHSGLGVPYQAWRITHAKHHASTCHMTQEQVYVPRTRAELGLPPLGAAVGKDEDELDGVELRDERLGARVRAAVSAELWDAIGDSPIGAVFMPFFGYLFMGWWLYILGNASGQRHFNPNAVMFAPHQYGQIMRSNLGIAIWLAIVIASLRTYGFAQVFRVYLVPYLWVNHWLVLITFLQHTDPLVPHYRAGAFTFPRGALSTVDRSLLGGAGRLFAWLGAWSTHGISETHVAHHVASRIPHYHAWEATDAIREGMRSKGVVLAEGRPGGWSEVLRVWRECKFVEDVGDVVFYKNAQGLAAARPVYKDGKGWESEGAASDSGIELEGN